MKLGTVKCLTLPVLTVVRRPKYLSNQVEIDQCIAVIVFKNNVKHDLLSVVSDKCMMLFALTVEKIHKCLFSQVVSDRYTVATAFLSTVGKS